MTDAKQPAQFDWATELSDAQGHVTLSKQEAKEIGARLRSMSAKLKAYEDLGDAGSDVQLLRTGYAAARLEIESLQARIKTMAEEHADELAVAHLDGRMRAAQPAGAQQPTTQTAPASQGDALSDDAVRVPLDKLHADAAYLIGRLREGSMPYARVIEIIRERIDAAKAAIRARAAQGDALDAADIRHGYTAKRDGSILNPDGQPLIPYRGGKGYLRVSLWRDGKRADEYVHRLIAAAFCTRLSDEQTQVNHRDGDRLNNRASNLEWCSPQENSIHAARVLFAQETRAVIGTSLTDGSTVQFQSLSEAEDHGFKRANIQKVIDGKRRSHGGFTWVDAAQEGKSHE